jgi:hypothetical protein
MAKAKVYKMWALFNYDRPPIFVKQTRHECVRKGIEWIGNEEAFKNCRREGSITIEKVVLRRTSTTSRGTR